ncbi:MAG: phosphoribosylanthranilate isomerase [Solirubrobacteraceae bacterium]
MTVRQHEKDAPRAASSASSGTSAAGAVEVKVCGITRQEDAELAVELGAWALGMVFYPQSPRRCSMHSARAVSAALRRDVALCGVFVNAPLDDVVAVAGELELALLQLHGDEGPAYCAEVARRSGARIIKAVQVRNAGDVTAAQRYHVDFHLLDTASRVPAKASLRGGTGETFDWSLLAGRRSRVPLILSGGLGPDNVADGIAAASSRRGLYAVDTASGTELAPGRKDPAKLRAFFAAVAGAREQVPAGSAA